MTTGASVDPPGSRTASHVGFLRSQTHSSHDALEQTLDLLRPPLEKARFTAVLSRFYGFHSVWEAAIAAHPAIAAFARDRSRLPLLRHDLMALGLSDREISRLPLCDDAAALARTEASALGSMYVVEGSSLGGRLISRGLAEQPWLPATGLTYFNPYGDRTGAMWQGFKAWCDAQASGLDWTQAAEGARATFALLQGWLTR
ncbi:MAG: biliverdin-producing heme oxygenase [Alphaproteobacteria bacterium]|nr:biliverdin-producing heme oxygenase [Alphaproteobacteria bacterium]